MGHIICESCWLDSKRNGHCTEPLCDQYVEPKK